MKSSFGYKLSIAILWSLHVLGASSVVMLVLALCKIRMTFWIGATTVIPGYLVCKALHSWYSYESTKRLTLMTKKMFDLTDEDIENIETSQENAVCPFNNDGACTFGDGLPECVKTQTGGDEDGNNSAD